MITENERLLNQYHPPEVQAVRTNTFEADILNIYAWPAFRIGNDCARVGLNDQARKWFARILISWGFISALTAFVHTPMQFYVARFLLGVAEAGFFPGMIFYLTLWFPKGHRGRYSAMFSSAIPLAGIIGGPLSGVILGMDGVAGLHCE